MHASIIEFRYGLKVDKARKHASVLQFKNQRKMINYVTLNSPSKILLEDTVQNYCALQRTQAVNLKISFQTLNVGSIPNYS